MPDKLNTTELDFDQIKNNLIEYFRNVKDSKGNLVYKDYDFSGSALNTLMGILAYNTHYNAMTAHMAINESFIDSAQLRSSVVSSAKLLGYVPRSSTSAGVDATITITGVTNNPSSLPASIYLDRNVVFKAASTYKTFYFTLKDGATFNKNSGDNTYSSADTLRLVEGQRVSRRYPFNGSYDYEKYVIDDDNIDIDSLIVRVYPTPNDTTNVTEYIRYNDISSIQPDAALYYIAENSLGKYELTFGNGIVSKKPGPLSVIEVEYIVTNGSAANDIKGQISLVSTPFNNTPDVTYTLQVAVSDATSGGSDRETVDEIRTNATYGFVSQNRAVTADDYRNIILNGFKTIKSVNVWGGEDNIPPQYGKVFIAAKKGGNDQSQLSASEKEGLLQVLSNKKVIAIIPEIVETEYVNIVLDVLFKYNSNITSSTKSQLENAVRTSVIDDYNSSALNGFGKIFRHSEFTKKVDNSNTAILNSHVRVFLSKTYSVNPESSGVLEGKYGAELTIDDGFAIASYQTNIPWLYRGVKVYLGDRADTTSTDKRILYTYAKNVDGSTYVVLENVGTLTLSTGILNLAQLDIADSELDLTIDLIPISDDIVSRRNQVVSIDVNRCNVSGYVDEIAVGGSSRGINYQTFKRDR